MEDIFEVQYLPLKFLYGLLVFYPSFHLFVQEFFSSLDFFKRTTQSQKLSFFAVCNIHEYLSCYWLEAKFFNDIVNSIPHGPLSDVSKKGAQVLPGWLNPSTAAFLSEQFLTCPGSSDAGLRRSGPTIS